MTTIGYIALAILTGLLLVQRWHIHYLSNELHRARKESATFQKGLTTPLRFLTPEEVDTVLEANRARLEATR